MINNQFSLITTAIADIINIYVRYTGKYSVTVIAKLLLLVLKYFFRTANLKRSYVTTAHSAKKKLVTEISGL